MIANKHFDKVALGDEAAMVAANEIARLFERYTAGMPYHELKVHLKLELLDEIRHVLWDSNLDPDTETKP